MPSTVCHELLPPWPTSLHCVDLTSEGIQIHPSIPAFSAFANADMLFSRPEGSVAADAPSPSRLWSGTSTHCIPVLVARCRVMGQPSASFLNDGLFPRGGDTGHGLPW